MGLRCGEAPKPPPNRKIPDAGGKVGCAGCGKEYGTNPDCACWGYGERKGATMKRGNNWWIGGWAEECPRCGLEIEDECSVYCSNCGKFLGEVRATLWATPLVAFVLFFVGGLGLLSGYLSPHSCPQHAIWFASICGGLGGLVFLSAIPLGNYALRRERWAEEAEERNAKREKERLEGMKLPGPTAATKPQINIQVKGANRTIEMIRKANEQIQSLIKKKKLRGVCNCGEGEESFFHSSLCEKAEGRARKRFPLMSGSGFAQTRLGTIEVYSDGPIRAQIDEGWGDLRYHANAKGGIGHFFLEQFPKPVAEETDYTPPTSGGELPVRNGPALFVSFKHSYDNHEGFEDIKRNLEDVYRVKSAGIWKEVEQLAETSKDVGRMRLYNLPVFSNRVNMPALPGQKITKIRIVDDGTGFTPFPQFSFEIEVQKIDDPSNPTGVGFVPKRCHKVFCSEACGVVINTHSPMGPNSCDKTQKDCMRWKNEERFSL